MMWSGNLFADGMLAVDLGFVVLAVVGLIAAAIFDGVNHD